MNARSVPLVALSLGAGHDARSVSPWPAAELPPQQRAEGHCSQYIQLQKTVRWAETSYASLGK